MPPLPQLAPLDAQDAALATELHALLQQAYMQEALLLGVDPSQFPPLQHPVHALQTGGEDWIGAWQEGQLVGALSLHADADDEAVGCIGALGVLPSEQRRGVATLLLHAALSRQGLGRPVSAQLALANAPALALFAQAGFKEWRRWSEPMAGQRLRFVKLLRRPS
ncbi:GNAT family N-acetyltransferase [Inhella sp.]|uniref:GNAT family N-acetyltransferase n=1 Tax=Inhella sp. TaxID=1921806 RepID=UPI0035B416B2